MYKTTWQSFVKSHHLIDRCFDMLNYLLAFDNYQKPINTIKENIRQQISNPYFVETLSRYFEDQLKRNRKKVEVYCNLKDLIYDLDYLKQYLL